MPLAIFNVNWAIFENFDATVYTFVEKFQSTFCDYFLGGISWLGDNAIVWLVLGVIMMCFKKTRKAGFVIALSVGVAGFCNRYILKELFERARPFDYTWTNGFNFQDIYRPAFLEKPIDNWSFPSGHTATAFAPALCVWYYQKHKAGIPAFIFAFLTGLSRIYVHDHFPSDVIGGILSGLLFGALTILGAHILFDMIIPAITKKSKKSKNDNTIEFEL